MVDCRPCSTVCNQCALPRCRSDQKLTHCYYNAAITSSSSETRFDYHTSTVTKSTGVTSFRDLSSLLAAQQVSYSTTESFTSTSITEETVSSNNLTAIVSSITSTSRQTTTYSSAFTSSVTDRVLTQSQTNTITKGQQICKIYTICDYCHLCHTCQGESCGDCDMTPCGQCTCLSPDILAHCGTGFCSICSSEVCLDCEHHEDGCTEMGLQCEWVYPELAHTFDVAYHVILKNLNIVVGIIILAQNHHHFIAPPWYELRNNSSILCYSKRVFFNFLPGLNGIKSYFLTTFMQ